MAAILVVVEGAGNRRALLEWLAPQHRICGLAEALMLDAPLDLIIVDRPALQRFGQAIAEHVRTAKMYLPVLLIVPRFYNSRHLMPPRRSGVALSQDLWEVDEIIRAPISKDELEVRIANLLRLREREKQLFESRERVRLAAEVAQLGFWEWDTYTNQVHFPLEWSKQLGYDDALPDRLEEWIVRLHPDDCTQALAEITRLKTAPHGDFEIEYRLRHRDGSYRWFRSNVALIQEHGPGSSRLVISQLDISAEKAAQDHIRQASQHDPLTGLPNRALLYEFAEHLLVSARRTRSNLAFLFFDLDRFKYINDTHGHHVGDELLQQVARRITELVRGEDLVGRLGGDEFLAVLPQIRKSDDAARVSHHALERLRQPYRIAGLELTCAPSIGVSLFPQDGETIEVLVQHADQAMYCAKEAGRNNVQFFTAALNQKAQAATAIEQRLRKGIEREEFQLFYQPVIDTQSAAVVGVEALIRWPQADCTDISPATFIPVAESTGLIRTLGKWVIHEACRQHRQWLRAGLPPIGVAINVSFAQFRFKGFAQDLAHAVNNTSIAPHYLSLELTEGTLTANVDDSARVLEEIKGLGIAIALDAFGTGIASLSQLGRLPIAKIKVDRSFIRNLESDSASRAIVEAAVAVGRTLDLKVVAEGVENEEMLQVVKRRQCHQVQGFHFCKPLPADEFARWYRERVDMMH